MRLVDDTPSYPLPSVSDYRLLAQKRLPKTLFEFIDGGAFQELTLERNRADFDKLQLRKRVLKTVGEIDKAYSLDLLQRASTANCPVLLLAVDLLAIGARHRYLRNGKSSFLSSLAHPGWFVDVHFRGGPLTLGNMPAGAPRFSDLPAMRLWMRNQLNPDITWKNLEWVRAHWPGKIVLKGILDREDAHLALESGVDGIIVSNHGARHIDSVPSTISVLPELVAASGKMDVGIDGGIMNGERSA